MPRENPEAWQKEREKFVICVSGMAGCGKSTVAKKLAKKFGFRYLSGGDALKTIALEKGYNSIGKDWWETSEGVTFLDDRLKNSTFDKQVDEKLIEWAERGNVVLDSWTMPWLFDGGFKVWLEASSEARAQRIAKRDGIRQEKALKALVERDEKTKRVYKNLYGFDLGEDFKPFDMVLDTSNLSSKEVFQALCLVVNRLYIKYK